MAKVRTAIEEKAAELTAPTPDPTPPNPEKPNFADEYDIWPPKYQIECETCDGAPATLAFSYQNSPKAKSDRPLSGGQLRLRISIGDVNMIFIVAKDRVRHLRKFLKDFAGGALMNEIKRIQKNTQNALAKRRAAETRERDIVSITQQEND